jgi:D-glycero-alpha-D-manno-heptose-7-phosphate kinase
MTIRSKAPLRISFCGGGTDLEYYYIEYGGLVLSATINKFAYGSFFNRDDSVQRIRSYDYDLLLKLKDKKSLEYNGKMDLIKSVLKNFQTNGKEIGGFDMYLHSDVPPGSGLGSSSTMTVALVGIMKEYFSLPYSNYEMAELAYEIERKDLEIKGGKQDQYAASFGGFNLIEFLKDKVVVNPLRIPRHIVNELEYNLLLCYTGKTRLSANIIDKQIDMYRNKRVETMKALGDLKDLTIEMKNLLLRGELNEFAEMLHVAGEHKKKVNPLVSTSFMDELYNESRKKGVIGGKVLGAGGGGYLLLYCPIQKRADVIERLEKMGGSIVSFSFDFRGLQVWQC